MSPAAAAVPNRYFVIAAAGVLTAAVAIAFAPVVRVLIGQWLSNDTYSFGVLVPFISTYFAWLTRARLRSLTPAPSPVIGTLLVAACSLVFVVGRITNVVGLQQIAMVAMLASLVCLLLGRRFVLALWFPLAYLLLMLPVWELFTNRLHYRSQLFSAQLGERLLSLAGVAVHRTGTYLELGNVTLEVASVCSGINFLIAVIAIGVPQAYWFLAGVLPRLLVIAFAVAIALLSNGVRIAVIGILAQFQLAENIHGPGHLLQGLLVSAIGLIAFHVAVRVMARKYPRIGPPGRLPFGVSFETARARPAGWSLAIAVALSIVLIAGAARFDSTGTIVQRVNGAAPPVPSVAGWELVRADRPARFVQGGPRANVAQVFRLPSGRRVELYVDTIAFADADGLGYRHVVLPDNVAASETPVKTPRGIVHVNRASYRQNEGEMHVVFWFDVHGEVTSQVVAAKLRVLQALFEGHSDGPLLVVLAFDGQDGSSASVDSLDDLVNQVSVALERPPAIARTGTGD